MSMTQQPKTPQPLPRSIAPKPWIFSAVLLFCTTFAHGWEHYGGDAGGSKYSPLTSIHAGNINTLKQAWTYRSGETGEGYADGRNLTFEATPIYWHGKLYFNSSFGKAYAIDAGTGVEIWRFDAGLDPKKKFSETAARGVSIWHDVKQTGATENQPICSHRIIFGTLRGELHALDAMTGKPCVDFGPNPARPGTIDLTVGVGPVEDGDYSITSPPAIIGDTLFVGSAIGDNRKVDSEHGIVRAIDVRSGRIKWSWDPIPRSTNDPARASWAGNSADISGGGNAWAPLSVDTALNLVFIPTSAASPDFYGGHRAGDNLYTNSVVALDADSGEPVWHQQLVHHDVWDFDTPAQPALVDIDLGNGKVPALIQVTKTGMMYVFDRRTGEPLIPIEERPVPQNGVDGEVLSPTQPFSSLPPLARHTALTEEDAFGILWFDKRSCAQQIRKYTSQGIFSPPTEAGIIMTPGYAGGINWGGAAIHADAGIAVAFVNELPTIVKLVPRAQFDPENPTDNLSWSRMSGTPYIMQRDPFLSALGLPCTQPPWGKLVAMDLKSRKIAWQRPLGTIADLAPAPVPNFEWGIPGMGGPLITKTGIVFIGAAAESQFRAFNMSDGELLWQAELPRPGNASPMTYQHEGRQYVVIAAGGHGQLIDNPSDFLVSFALEE